MEHPGYYLGPGGGVHKNLEAMITFDVILQGSPPVSTSSFQDLDFEIESIQLGLEPHARTVSWLSI